VVAAEGHSVSSVFTLWYLSFVVSFLCGLGLWEGAMIIDYSQVKKSFPPVQPQKQLPLVQAQSWIKPRASQTMVAVSLRPPLSNPLPKSKSHSTPHHIYITQDITRQYNLCLDGHPRHPTVTISGTPIASPHVAPRRMHTRGCRRQ